MANFSFDIVSDYDLAEVNNFLQQTKRELDNRYDFKGTSAGIEWLDSEKTGFKITGDSQYQLDSILEIVRKTLGKRGLNQKILDTSAETVTSNLKTSQAVKFKKGIDQEKAKKITNTIRQDLPKIKAQIQGDEIRVTSTSKNDLQAAMQLIREKELDFPVQFTNFR